MKKHIKALRDSKILLSAIAVSFTVLLFDSIGFAQLIGRPDRGYQAGNSYAISDIESVNMTGGNVSMNIPLASLPAGRGTAPGYGVSLTYDSKLWNLEQEWNDDGTDPEINGPASYTRNLLQNTDEGGWHLRYGYALKVINRNESGRREPCVLGNSNYNKNSFIWRVEMQMPDGSTKTLRPYGLGPWSADQFADGFFEVDPNGYAFVERLGSTIEGQPYCPVTPTSVTTSGMNYYSTDGSGVRLFVPYVASGTWNGSTNRKWQLYFPDGTLVENSPADDPTAFQRTTDRNGNQVALRGGTVNGLSGTKIEDQTGRFIFVAADTNGDTKVIQSSVNGEQLETTVKWKEHWVYRNYNPLDISIQPIIIPEYKRRADVIGSFLDVDKIILPLQASSLTYEFTYHADDTQPIGSPPYTNGWGEIASVKLPSGAKAEYKYNLPENENVLTRSSDVIKNSIIRKDLKYDATYDGQTSQIVDTWLYNIVNGYGTVTAPDGSVTTQTSFFKSPYFKDSASDWNAGLVYQSTNADGSKTEKMWEQNGSSAVNVGQPINPYVKTELTNITNAAGQLALTAIKDYVYDQNMNVLEIKEYDWVSYSSAHTGGPWSIPAGAVLKRKTVNTYYNPTPSMGSTIGANYYANPSSTKLKKVIKSSEIQDGNGTPVSRSEFFYDDPDNKGNLTETRVWDSTKGALASPDSNGSKLNSSNSISTFAEYDQYGNVIKTKDAKLVETTMTYGNVAGPSGNVTGLYPTQVETASNYSTLKRTSTAVYDFYTGLTTTATDVDNNVSVVTEYDALGRPTKVRSAANTALESWTRTEYHDVDRFVVVRSDLETVGDGKKVATQFYDQLGRVRLSKTLEDAATQSATNETDGIKVETRYQTGNPNSYQITSNPFRAATATAATTEPTMGWTRSKSVNTGKHSEVETFSGPTLPAPWGSNANSTGVATTDIDADRTLVTDQAGKQRISRTNALGQLKDIWEVKGSDADTEPITFGALSLNGLKTSYSYDTLNNLTTVNQGVQTRSFTYSSLSRLLSATNPELGTTPTNGTIFYQYDNNGNLTQKTDPRGVATNYVYDVLNRVESRSYTAPANLPNYEATLPVTYTYDNVTNAKGRLTKVTNGFSTTEYLTFDTLGRVTRSKQTTDGVVYGTDSAQMTYAYNLSGALIEQKYPSGRVVKNVLDNEGDLEIVQSKKNANSGYWNYAKNFTYAASGAVTSVQLGNGKWESTQFNSRLQPTQIALGLTQNSTNLLKLDYSYGPTQNNGNVQAQTITVNRSNQSPLVFNQTYVYDSLNRLKSAEETTGTTTNWKQTYMFDRFGNRNFDEANTTTLLKNCTENSIAVVCPADRKVINPEINVANNRIALTQDYVYDAAGNVITDAEGRTFKYDAENKQIEVKNSGTTVIGTYFFDGGGKRVKKYVPSTGETTIFLYDAIGKLVAEYSTVVTPEPAAKVQYLTNDNLGTPRINTDKDGNVVSRTDYMPYGEEIVGLGNRTANENYVADDIRQGFTGYEKDDETGLEFAQARMYANALGRFTGCDPIYASKEHPIEPQRWNLYVYVINNPLNTIDADGQKPKRIDVYIAFGDSRMPNYDNKKYLKSLESAIRKAIPKDIKVTVRGFDQSTPDNVAQSLRSKGTTVIIAAHLDGRNHLEMDERNSRGKPRTGAQGVSINGGYVTGSGVEVITGVDKNQNVTSYTVKEEIKADNVFIFSCQIHPNTASQIGDRMQSGSFVYIDGGNDGESDADVDVRIATGAAIAIGNGGNAETVADVANILIRSVGSVVNQGDEKAVICDSNGKCKPR
jgi:RHS repeat-associated protein